LQTGCQDPGVEPLHTLGILQSYKLNPPCHHDAARQKFFGQLQIFLGGTFDQLKVMSNTEN